MSITNLQRALGQKKKNRRHLSEKYSDSVSGGLDAAGDTFFVVIALIFVVFEFILLVFAIIIALRCTKSGVERIVHFVMALIFTLPYILLNSLFNGCAINMMRGDINYEPVVLKQP